MHAQLQLHRMLAPARYSPRCWLQDTAAASTDAVAVDDPFLQQSESRLEQLLLLLPLTVPNFLHRRLPGTQKVLQP
jgi:hypothetical protein